MARLAYEGGRVAPEYLRQVGANLLALRDICGLSRDDAGNAIEVSYSAIRAVELSITEPRFTTVLKLARFYGFDIEELLTEPRRDWQVRGSPELERALKAAGKSLPPRPWEL